MWQRSCHEAKEAAARRGHPFYDLEVVALGSMEDETERRSGEEEEEEEEDGDEGERR